VSALTRPRMHHRTSVSLCEATLLTALLAFECVCVFYAYPHHSFIAKRDRRVWSKKVKYDVRKVREACTPALWL
jgi:hypothetical protein